MLGAGPTPPSPPPTNLCNFYGPVHDFFLIWFSHFLSGKGFYILRPLFRTTMLRVQGGAHETRRSQAGGEQVRVATALSKSYVRGVPVRVCYDVVNACAV